MKTLIFCLFMAAITFNSYAQSAKEDTTYFKHKNINYSKIKTSDGGYIIISNIDVKYEGDEATRHRSNNGKNEGWHISNIKEYHDKIHKKLIDDAQIHILKYLNTSKIISQPQKKRDLLDYAKREQKVHLLMFTVLVEKDASFFSIRWYLHPSGLDYFKKVDIANLDNEMRKNLTIEKSEFDTQRTITLMVILRREELIKFLENELAKPASIK